MLEIRKVARRTKSCSKVAEQLRDSPTDKGLTLETSAFESLYGGQFTLSTQLIKPNYLAIFLIFDHLKIGVRLRAGALL